MSDETNLVNIDIDGIPAALDAAEYESNPDDMIEAVRKARAKASDLTGIHEPAEWDYNSLAEAYGEDDTTEVK